MQNEFLSQWLVNSHSSTVDSFTFFILLPHPTTLLISLYTYPLPSLFANDILHFLGKQYGPCSCRCGDRQKGNSPTRNRSDALRAVYQCIQNRGHLHGTGRGQFNERLVWMVKCDVNACTVRRALLIEASSQEISHVRSVRRFMAWQCRLQVLLNIKVIKN